MKRASFLLVLALFASGCELATEATAQRRMVGILEWQTSAQPVEPSDPATVVTAPDTVTVGRAFSVTVRTIGLSGCWREDGADVTAAHELLRTITPYDRVITTVDGAAAMCTGALVALPRDIALVFTQRGTATLRVTGRKVVTDQLQTLPPAAVEKTIEKQIVVR